MWRLVLRRGVLLLFFPICCRGWLVVVLPKWNQPAVNQYPTCMLSRRKARGCGGTGGNKSGRGDDTVDPIRPIRADQTIITRRWRRISCEGHNGKPNAVPTPIVAPPPMAASNPRILTPPFVPGGTVFNVVIRNGGLFDRIPSSEDHVSAFAAA